MSPPCHCTLSLPNCGNHDLQLPTSTTGYYSGVLRDGQRVVEKRPTHASIGGLWTEGSAIQWLFHVMHDFKGLLHLIGRARMVQRLDYLFTSSPTADLQDTTGLIGSYAQGNEPSHHAIFWWYLLGEPHRADTYIDIVLRMYTDAADGLPGNDDAGQSAPIRVFEPVCWRAALPLQITTTINSV